MRTTVTLDDELVRQAQELTGIEERSALIRAGLRALVEREAARRLALLKGSDPHFEAGRRQRSEVDPA
jgi:Arc/MetJ family transcription regulator